MSLETIAGVRCYGQLAQSQYWCPVQGLSPYLWQIFQIKECVIIGTIQILIVLYPWIFIPSLWFATNNFPSQGWQSHAVLRFLDLGLTRRWWWRWWWRWRWRWCVVCMLVFCQTCWRAQHVPTPPPPALLVIFIIGSVVSIIGEVCHHLLLKENCIFLVIAALTGGVYPQLPLDGVGCYFTPQQVIWDAGVGEAIQELAIYSFFIATSSTVVAMMPPRRRGSSIRYKKCAREGTKVPKGNQSTKWNICAVQDSKASKTI